MPEQYVSLAEAARYEDIKYHALQLRVQRSPQSYKTKREPREYGKPCVLVAVSSLSPKARKLYRADHKTQLGDDLIMESTKDQAAPWYLEADFHWYIENYPKQYATGEKLAELMREFTDYCGADRTGFGIQFAAANGMTQRTLYRLSQSYLAASALALQYERKTGKNHDFFRVLALCRKPKGNNKFPSISDEIKATIENVWFDEIFRQNRGTVQMLYDKLIAKCAESEVFCPSYATISRYIQHIMETAHSTAYLAERGTRDWKNAYMMKGERDIKSLAVMEIVVGDVHTFDLWVKYTPANGRPIAIRPKLIAWIDMRTRRFFSFAMCRESNSDIVKNSFAKGVFEHGAPMNVLIDNGKDFANEETLGHDRKERMIFNSELAGFYKSMGVQEVFRSLPFQPWDKIIERSFLTVCNKFSKWFNSYTGTLTGSKTEAKVRKDIKGMLERDELFTLGEFYTLWENWVDGEYNMREHRGLKDSGEEYTTPQSLFENDENRYFKAAPPESYIAMLLMRSKRVPVKTTGIRHNKALYMCAELMPHINAYVNIRWNPDDESMIYAFSEDGALIGEIPLAEKLNAHFYADEAQVEAHKRDQNRQLRDQREALAAYRTPFDQRPENADATPKLVGGLELTLGKSPQHNVVSLPVDAALAGEARKAASDKAVKLEYLDKLGDAVFEKLKNLG